MPEDTLKTCSEKEVFEVSEIYMTVFKGTSQLFNEYYGDGT